MKRDTKQVRQLNNALLKIADELSKSNRACMCCSVSDICSRRQSAATNCTLHIINKYLNEGVAKNEKRF